MVVKALSRIKKREGADAVLSQSADAASASLVQSQGLAAGTAAGMGATCDPTTGPDLGPSNQLYLFVLSKMR
jgi:hypothetical protein